MYVIRIDKKSSYRCIFMRQIVGGLPKWDETSLPSIHTGHSLSGTVALSLSFSKHV